MPGHYSGVLCGLILDTRQWKVSERLSQINNNNNSETDADVYVAVFIARPFWEFIWFILVNAEWMPRAANPQTESTDLGCEPACRLLPSTPTVAICYDYTARRLTLILHLAEGRMLSRPRWLVTDDWDVLASHRRSPVSRITYIVLAAM